MATTQATISSKQINKGAKAILALTSTLGQVLKQFQDIYNKALDDTDGMTVESWMDAMGVHRDILKDKKGKVKGKAHYTPANVFAAWHVEMKSVGLDGTHCCVFKNVPAKTQCVPGLDNNVLASATDKHGNLNSQWYRVFTKEEAEKIDGKPIARYMLVDVPADKWSVATILKGLKQTRNFTTENEKMVMSDQEWEKLEHVYVIRFDKNEQGEITRRVIEVSKDSVEF